MATKTIRGRLVPSNAEAAACAFVRVRLYWSFTENGLRNLVTSDSKWDENGISFNSIMLSSGSIQETETFVRALDNVMHTEDAIRLGLSGYFDIEMDIESKPVTLRVEIADGKISYWEIQQVRTDKVAV